MAKVVPIRKAIPDNHNGRYILRGRVPFPEPNLLKWAASLDSHERIVAQTKIRGDVIVSTIFLGLDHRFGEGPPLLFETMVFNGKRHGFMLRSCTWEAAEDAHKEACDIVRKKK